MKTFALPSLASVLAVFLTGGLSAQDLQFSSVTATPTTFAGASGNYRTVENAVSGTSLTDDSYSFTGFNVTVGTASGSAAGLAGQSFLALCVNLGYEAPGSGVSYDYSTDETGLSYTPTVAGASDYWSTANAAAKYAAIKDIVNYAVPLAGTDQSSIGFQEWMVAITLAINEVVADFGQTNFGNLSAGDLQVYQGGSFDALPSSILDKYNSAIGVAGDGSGSGLALHTASIGGTAFQDVILVAIPEPSAALLGGAAMLLGALRRRRNA